MEKIMITLKECLIQTNWSDISSDLSRLFPEHTELMASYQTAFQELTRTGPVVNNTRITISRYKPNGVLPFFVVGFEGECHKGICLKFIPWQRWLGATIDPSLHHQYRHSEIVAICLQDMTWAGFSSNEVLTFRREFIDDEDRLWAIYAYEEAIEASEPNLIKRKQRSIEFNEALNLFDIDHIFPAKNETAEYCQARSGLDVQIYCLSETETDYDDYRAKVTVLREDFQLRWPDSSRNRPHEH